MTFRWTQCQQGEASRCFVDPSRVDKYNSIYFIYYQLWYRKKVEEGREDGALSAVETRVRVKTIGVLESLQNRNDGCFNVLMRFVYDRVYLPQM